VGRTKDTSNAERDRRICLLRRNGFTFSEIAQMEDISRVRVAQIYHQRNPELEEDVGRAEIAGILEFAERKAVELANEPGFMMAPTGGVAHDDDGEPVPNKTIVNEALKTLILVADRKSRLYGWDKQQMKQRKAEEEARAEMNANLAGVAAAIAADRMAVEERHRRELEEARRPALHPTVAGEMVRAELAPPAPSRRS
jgi:hypothetical protein